MFSPGREGTDQYDAIPGAPGRPGRPHRRSERTVGLVVLGVVVAGAVVAGVLLLNGSGHHAGTPNGTPSIPSGPAAKIDAVQVYLSVTGHSLDNPNQTGATFDGNPATAWTTDQYRSPTFGNLYPGIGLEIHLANQATLRTLTVTSATQGWSASTYVSSDPVGTGTPLSAWGAATSSKTGITGATTFSLGDRKGQYVLLWITNLGPADEAQVSELAVH